MLKIKLFKKSSQNIWPFLRYIVRDKISKRCNNCIVSERYTQLHNGICNACSSYDQNLLKPQSKLEKSSELDITIKKYIGNGKKGYDALILFSGGKDSTLMVYNIQKMFPELRVLAVTIDNGFMSPVALKNIDNITNKLHLNHIILKSGGCVFHRAFKYGIETVKGRGCSQVVDRLDGDLFHDIAIHHAAKMDIPLVISGLSVEQVEDIININDFILPSSYLEKRREYSGMLSLSDFVEPEDFNNAWWSPESYDVIPQVLYPNYIWNYSHDLIHSVLYEKCGLSDNQLDPMLTNNKLIPVMGVIDIRQIGYSSFEPEFAKMVRAGTVNRHYWLNIFQYIEYLAKYSTVFDADIRKIFNHLGVNEKEVFYG